MKKRIVSVGKQAAIVALSILTFSGVGYVFAQPTVAPGNGAGVALPLTTSGDTQTKTGALTVNGELSSTYRVSAPEICIAGDCQTSWPSGGSSLQAGTGRGLSPSSYYSAYGGSGQYDCYNANIYYSNGNSYGTSNYCANSIQVIAQISAPGTVLSTSNVQLRCGLDYGYYGYNADYWFQNNGSTNPYYMNATNVTVSTSGSVITVSGTCYPTSWWNWIIPAAQVDYLYQ